MPEIISKQKLKNEVSNTKVLKSVDTTIPTKKKSPTTQVVVTTKAEKQPSKRFSLVSDNKIRKILDEHRINTDTITAINKIKSAIAEGKEFKSVLTDKEIDIVGEYFECNKAKLKKEEEVGKLRAKESKTTFKAPSTNQIALRAFVYRKYKFKKDLSQYLGIICDLMVEEIISTTMENVVKINKKLINISHIIPGDLSDKLLYPLYCNLPSFVALSKVTSEDLSTEEVKLESGSTLTEEEQKIRDVFKGTIKVIFNKLKNEEGLKIKKPYQLFLSNLIIEFLDRITYPLLVTVKNNSRNQVVVKNMASTVIEYIMYDYSQTEGPYCELLQMIHQRSKNNL